jgi:hypothetical protein
VGEDLLAGKHFKRSENDFDWLGSGIYFWETNPRRGLDWAQELQRRKAAVTDPFVVGAVVDLGFCLDMISSNGTQAVKLAFQSFTANMHVSGKPLPSNVGGSDLFLRRLDCAVINHLHNVREVENLAAFDSVRGVFIEGNPVYEGSGFREKAHIQICVRNPDRIKGVFRVRDEDL